MFIILAGTCKASSAAGADRLCTCCKWRYSENRPGTCRERSAGRTRLHGSLFRGAGLLCIAADRHCPPGSDTGHRLAQRACRAKEVYCASLNAPQLISTAMSITLPLQLSGQPLNCSLPW